LETVKARIAGYGPQIHIGEPHGFFRKNHERHPPIRPDDRPSAAYKEPRRYYLAGTSPL